MKTKQAKQRQRARNAVNQPALMRPKGPVLGTALSQYSGPRRRRKSPSGIATTQVVPLPPRFIRNTDYFSMRLRTTININNYAANAASLLLVLTPNPVVGVNYAGLGDLFVVLPGISSSYAHFMLSRIEVMATPITPATAGGYVALGYEADNSVVSSPPTTLSDCTTAIHSDLAQVSETAVISFMVSDYFNEWRSCSNSTAPELAQAGVLQFLASNNVGTGVPAFIINIEIDIHFSGYRAKI